MSVVSALSPLAVRPNANDDMARIEAALGAAVLTDDPLLTEMASHLIPAGGKRLRPAFVVAAALSARPDGDAPDAVSDDMVTGGVAVELVHLGSLYHDDVMDDAQTRRGIEAVNYRWGNLKAILAGDFLLAKASELAAGLGTEVAGLLAATIARLCEGQVRELGFIYDTSRTEAQYLEAIRGKTAELYATSCRIGGLVASLGGDTLGGDPLGGDELDRLEQFGRSYGMAFQIVDDILDLTSNDVAMGKPTGNDLREGVYTLPVLRTLADGGALASELRSLLVTDATADQLARARSIVLSSGHIESAVSAAGRYVDEAVRCLRLRRGDGLGGEPAGALGGESGSTPTARGMSEAAANLLASLRVPAS